MHWKKSCTWVLMLLFVTTLAAGCGGGDKPAAPQAAESSSHCQRR